MNIFVILSGAVLVFLMMYNFMAKSFLISLAVIALTMFVLFKIPIPVEAVDYYPLLACYLVIFFDVGFIIKRVEHW